MHLYYHFANTFGWIHQSKVLNEFAESFDRFLSTAPRDFPLIWRCKELMGPGMTTSSVWKPSGYNHAGGRGTVLCDHQTNQS